MKTGRAARGLDRVDNIGEFRSFSAGANDRRRVPQMQHAGGERPSLRRTPAVSSRTRRSESSLPQPLNAASKPSTRSRSARQIARLQERAPCQPVPKRRNGPSGSYSTGASRLTPPAKRCPTHVAKLQRSGVKFLAQHLVSRSGDSTTRLPVTNQPGSASGDASRRNPAARCSRRREKCNSAREARIPRLRISPARKVAMLVPDMLETGAQAPAFQRRSDLAVGGRSRRRRSPPRSRDRFGGKRPQDRVERVVAVIGRDDDGNQLGHGALAKAGVVSRL